MRLPLALAAALLASAALAEESRLEELQTSDAPLRVDDAMTQSGKAQGQVLVRNSTDEGDEGVFLVPMLEVPLTDTAELGAEFELGRMSGETELGALEVHAAQKLINEEGFRPAVTARLTGITPHEDVGFGGRAELLATEKLERFRAHLNAAYTAQNNAGDRYLGGAAADYAFSENVMVVGATWVERQRDEEQTVLGGEGGAAFQLGEHFVFHATGGAMRTDEGTVPRLGIAVSAR